MSGSAHRIICASCRQDMGVSETPVPNPNGVSSTHLHAVCENTACPEKGKVIHKDVTCSGSPVCESTTIRTGTIHLLSVQAGMAAGVLRGAAPVTKLAVTVASSALVERAPQSP
jgi:hypothetical protein